MNKCSIKKMYPEVAEKKAIDSIVEEMREAAYSLTKVALINGENISLNISPYKLSRLIDRWREELERVTI